MYLIILYAACIRQPGWKPEPCSTASTGEQRRDYDPCRFLRHRHGRWMRYPNSSLVHYSPQARPRISLVLLRPNWLCSVSLQMSPSGLATFGLNGEPAGEPSGSTRVQNGKSKPHAARHPHHRRHSRLYMCGEFVCSSAKTNMHSKVCAHDFMIATYSGLHLHSLRSFLFGCMQ